MASRDLIRHYRLHHFNDKTSVYFIDGLLIDCGSPRMRKSLDPILAGHPIDQVAISHYHEQHSGNADYLNEKGWTPFLSAKGMEILKNGFPPQLAYRRFMYGEPQKARFQEAPEVIRTSHFSFKVIPTPGHSPDHVCLYEPNEGWLFAGDLYFGSLFKYIKREENIYDLIRSYEVIKDLPISVMYCSHIGSITDPKYLLENKWFTLTSLRDAVTNLKNRGMSYSKIKKAIQFKEGWRYFVTQGDKAKANFILSILRDEPE